MCNKTLQYKKQISIMPNKIIHAFFELIGFAIYFCQTPNNICIGKIKNNVF
jgi:hypothetical protein